MSDLKEEKQATDAFQEEEAVKDPNAYRNRVR
jgi:hypothetical protein